MILQELLFVTVWDREQAIRRPQWVTARWLKELSFELMPQVDRGSGRIDPCKFIKPTEQEQDLILNCACNSNAKQKAASRLWNKGQVEVSQSFTSQCHNLEM